MVDIQSYKILKNKGFIEINASSTPSKARLFLSLQIVRQGDYDHVCLANKVNKLIGVLGITNLTPKNGRQASEVGCVFLWMHVTTF